MATYTKLALILGNCLFSDHSLLHPDSSTIFFMAEDKGLCTHFKYHKHKIAFFLLAMREHRDYLLTQYSSSMIVYCTFEDRLSYEEKLLECLKKHSISHIVTYTIEDHFMRDRITQFCVIHSIILDVVDSPGFVTSVDVFSTWSSGQQKLLMQNFYMFNRKRLDVLVDNGKPVGGQWSFDHENRKKIPKGVVIPSIPTIAKSKYFADVDRIISTHFSSHPGNLDTFFLPVTYGDSVIWMLDFFSRRFSLFGPYEDAILSDEAFLFHSQLSALINVGLLTPKQVVDEALAWFRLHPEHIASVEGFIRQIIGWREFIRGVYHTQHLVGNHFNHTRRLTADWYNGTTGIDPLDDVIKRVDTFAYAHHIERLMVVGNIMLLSEIHPDDVYKWFMEMFVDSSDWVMLPNVYGMSQFADGGVFATKPYICGSNYILKMSDYAKGEWCDILDGLYWRFINKHREFFLKNPRLSMMVSLFDKMDEGKKKRLSVAAERFLAAKTL